MQSIEAVSPSNIMDEEKMKYLLASSKSNGFDVTIIGIGKKFSWLERIKWFQEYLKTTESEIVCFTDAYDVFYLDSLNTIKEKFLEFNSDIVWSAEKWFSHQLPCDKVFYDSLCNTDFGYKYINAGTFIGYRHALLRVFNDILNDSLNHTSFIEDFTNNGVDIDPIETKFDDQMWIGHHICKNWSKYSIKLDYHCKIFYVACGDWDDISKFIDTNMKVISTDQTPSIIHVPWKSNYEYILKKLFNTKYSIKDEPSVCINCVLFTLKNADIKLNKYIQIFQMWLSRLIADGGMFNSDAIHLYIDTETANYLNSDLICNTLIQKFPGDFHIFAFPPPETLLDGVMYRYQYQDYKQDIYMYCDIDILFVKSIHLITDSLSPNTIYVHNEGPLTDPNYGAAFTENEITKFQENTVGFSCGKFIIYGKDIHLILFNNITHLRSISNEVYYTLDQPYFNKVIYLMLTNNVCQINMEILQNPIISLNFHGFSKDTILLDAMGQPGDGIFHFDKLFQYYIMLHSGI